MSYLNAAIRVGEWLTSVANQTSAGWCWPTRPDVSTEPKLSLYSGTAGPTLFFIETYRTTGEDRWLATAKEGARWLWAHIDDCFGSWAGCGLFTGAAGWAVVFDQLGTAGADEWATTRAGKILRRVAAEATGSGNSLHWHGLTEMIWGTAGVGCVILSLGPKYLGPRATEVAMLAGDWLIGQAEAAVTGIRWSLGPGYEEEPGTNRRYPNFAHGAAGIGFFLARLAQVTGEERFLTASLAATDWIMTTARIDSDSCAAFHHEPDGTDLFTLGWCHGPPGLGSFFRQLELTTGASDWRAWLRRAARADSSSGIPLRKELGFWDNVARCCGSAGVAEFFLDLYRLEARHEDLDFAVVLVDDLLGRAVSDGSGMRWSNYEYRNADPDLPPETGYMQGAAGIGSTLLRLHRQLSGDPWVVPWPHSPSCSPATGNAS